MLLSLAFMHKKKLTLKLGHLVKEDESGLSQEQEEEAEEEVISQSLSQGELRDIGKEFCHHQG